MKVSDVRYLEALEVVIEGTRERIAEGILHNQDGRDQETVGRLASIQLLLTAEPLGWKDYEARYPDRLP